jgi:hypothetical protein
MSQRIPAVHPRGGSCIARPRRLRRAFRHPPVLCHFDVPKPAAASEAVKGKKVSGDRPRIPRGLCRPSAIAFPDRIASADQGAWAAEARAISRTMFMAPHRQRRSTGLQELSNGSTQPKVTLFSGGKDVIVRIRASSTHGLSDSGTDRRSQPRLIARRRSS